MISKGETLPIYELDNGNKCLYLTIDEVDSLKNYSFVLSQLLNYKWAQLLEKFNNAPRIASKVKGISKNKIQRNALTKYKNILIACHENDKLVDFYTGEPLTAKTATVDHVIPWSFMYSDDIWNMVLTSRSMNSSKSNHIPDKVVIDKLVERNKELLKTIKDEKYKNELQNAIEQDYVHKFYIACKL